ncbi:hypothetical protein HHL23_05685 [Chryseobacterium sp. RP-3-3]|uniref:Uncharacterized protein n=1 Tax=Chryseobacterium antibioticum TaxID=2728847 RepID=A0A7Y0FRC0_9FLAO|nr:hypothetical protein [Chryseobacterium antibioticum]NML69284.1 hypothetical protein [Chryseobacterium antibioticum]
MKRSNLYLILFFFYINCQSQHHDGKVIYLSNNDIQTVHYFHVDSEYARVYGSSIKSDSLVFTRDKNDLIVKEFKYNDQQKKRITTGNIKYINYYSKLSDIVASENTFSMDEVPITNFNFLKKDLEIERMIKENCKHTKDGYNGCDFMLPKNSELPYWPDNSTITSAKIKTKKNRLDEIEFQAKYFDTPFSYKRNYYYHNKNIEKIITSVKDSTVESYEEKFVIVKVGK